MRKVKLLAIQLSPIVGIFEGDQMIGESEAPSFKIYPGNDLNDIIKQLKAQLEVDLDESDKVAEISRTARGKEDKSLQGFKGNFNNRNRKEPGRQRIK